MKKYPNHLRWEENQEQDIKKRESIDDGVVGANELDDEWKISGDKSKRKKCSKRNRDDKSMLTISNTETNCEIKVTAEKRKREEDVVFQESQEEKEKKKKQKIKNNKKMNLEKSTADNEWKDSGVESTAEKLLKNTEINEKSNDDILGSELSPKDKNIIDIDTEKVNLKKKIIALEAKIITLEVKREEVEVAIKQIENDMSKCTSKTDQQELSAKLSAEENIYISLTQEIAADQTRINFLASQMNGINLPSSSDRGK
jgi:hypothetical protein